jgi:beta-galactosidase
LCVALVQSSGSPGKIQVEASSPGLVSSVVAIDAKPDAAEARPKVPIWERLVPEGPGVTGLWRPSAGVSGGGVEALQISGGGDMVFTLRQEGSTVNGTVEAAPSGFAGGSAGGAIEDGRIDGPNISFRAGTATYTGTASEDRIELRRNAPNPFGGGNRGARPAPPNSDARPAIGPLPDGSDPSLGGAGRPAQNSQPLVLRRAKR